MDATASDIAIVRAEICEVGYRGYAAKLGVSYPTLKLWLAKNPHWQPLTADEGRALRDKRRKDPEVCRRQSERMSMKWAEAGYAERVGASISKARSTPDASKRQSDMVKAKFADPVYRAKHHASMRAVWDDPDYRKRLSAAITEVSNTPEGKAAKSRAAKRFWGDVGDDVRARLGWKSYACDHLTPDVLEKLKREYPITGYSCLYSYFPHLDPMNLQDWKDVRSAIKRVHGVYLYQEGDRSTGEIEVEAYLKQKGVIDVRHCPAGDILNPIMLELDMYSRERRLAVEYNGLFWHSLACAPKNEAYYKNRHRLKFLACRKAGIDLIQFWDLEWNTKRDICKSIINARLGLIARFPARKTAVKRISSDVSCEFLGINHIQGPVKAEFHLGLYDNDRLLSVMAISRNRFGGDYDYEIARHANLLNFSVQGGFSKLFKFACRNFFKSGDKIIDYTDVRLFRADLPGCGHPHAGFTSELVTEPSLYYYDKAARKLLSGSTFRSGEKCAKMGITFSSMQEKYDKLAERGIYRVWDAGKIRNTYTVP
jgi:hypothetical protein